MQNIFLITGTHGAGKSTFKNVLDGLKMVPEHSVSPSKIADIHGVSEEEALRRLIDKHTGFTYELPLDRSIMDAFFSSLLNKDFCVVCYYIGLENYEESINREHILAQQMQLAEVLPDAIVAEYERMTEDIQYLMSRVERIQFWDNTQSYKVVAHYADGHIKLEENAMLPSWIRTVKDTLDPDPVPRKTIHDKIDWQGKVKERKFIYEKESDSKRADSNSQNSDQRGKKTGNRVVLRRIPAPNAKRNSDTGRADSKSDVQQKSPEERA